MGAFKPKQYQLDKYFSAFLDPISSAIMSLSLRETSFLVTRSREIAGWTLANN